MAVGDWWQYQVAYYQGGTSIDTLVLKAVSVVTIGSSANYTCQLSQNGTVIDSGHFVQSDSMLSYTGSTRYSTFGFFNLRFPFSEGQRWPGIYPGDTITDTGFVDSFKAMGVIYTPLFTLRRVFNDPHYSMIQDIFLTPKIGLVFQTIDVQSDTAPDIWESMQLINYHIQ